MQKLKILVMSNVEWSNENAFGNTMSNILNMPEKYDIACLYRRNAQPNNNVCFKYYQISYTSMLKNIFKKENIGRYFETYETKKEKDNFAIKEGKLIRFIHKWKLTRIVYKAENVLFKSKRWENKRFKQFIKDFNPDILIGFTSSLLMGSLLAESVKSIASKCKYVTFITDDLYGANKSKRVRNNIKKQIFLADKIYAISPTLKDKYEKLYNRPIEILRKGCEITSQISRKNNNPKQIVYAGNLLYGRYKTLLTLIKEINDLPIEYKSKIFLKIYSPTNIDEKMRGNLTKQGVSCFYGARCYNEIKGILSQADLVLHVESYDKKQQEIVKHSFSTKITDCIQSGAIPFIIGPNGITSVEMAKEIPGAIVVNEISKLKDILLYIIDKDLYDLAIQTREYAVDNYEINATRKKLFDELNTMCE